MPYINVTLATGRSTETKQTLMAAIAEAVHETIDAPLETVRVWITEIPVEEMSIGGVPLDEVRRQRAAATAKTS
jgi:4-oxalocrotonate tautomerase